MRRKLEGVCLFGAACIVGASLVADLIALERRR